jgi:hypothetical protein
MAESSDNVILILKTKFYSLYLRLLQKKQFNYPETGNNLTSVQYIQEKKQTEWKPFMDQKKIYLII